MKPRKSAARVPIEAAGGIVLRGDREPLFGVVQLRKRDEWVLPKGKLHGGETALAAAAREVTEETGHEVSVHEFLGTVAYEVGRAPKVVQFWRMQAGARVRPLMRDVRAVEWLPLDDAIERLTHAREQAFLGQVGPALLAHLGRVEREPAARPAYAAPEPVARAEQAGLVRGVWNWLTGRSTARARR